MSVDSIKKRYFYKVFTNLISVAFNFLTAGIVPKSLGVENYGNYSYVNNIYTQIYGLLDFKSSVCLYVNLPRTNRVSKLNSFYFIFAICLISFILVFTLVSISTPLSNLLFQGTHSTIILLSFIFITVTWLLDLFSLIFDGLGLTVSFEKIRLYNRIITLLLILLIYYLKVLNIYTYFIFQICTALLLVLIILLLYKKKVNNQIYVKTSIEEKKEYFKLFYEYSKPLALYSILQFVGNIFDRWYLQQNGGSLQQGFFSFAFSLMSFSSIFINAFQPLITREFSIAIQSKESEQIKRMYLKYNFLLFIIMSYFCFFVSFNSSLIVSLFGGQSFSNSSITLQILVFYPLLSSYSLVNSSIIYSLGENKIFLYFTYFLLPLGVIMDIVLINPNFGINIGATGLAIKNVFVNFVSIILITRYISNKIKIDKLQLIKPVLFSSLFIIAALISSLFIYLKDVKAVYLLFLAGSTYTLLLVFLFFLLAKIGIIKDSIYQEWKEMIDSNFKKLKERFNGL